MDADLSLGQPGSSGPAQQATFDLNRNPKENEASPKLLDEIYLDLVNNRENSKYYKRYMTTRANLKKRGQFYRRTEA